MCLGVPGRIVAIDGSIARVDFWGVEREVRLDIIDAPVSLGGYVLNHVGFAIRRIPAQEVEETLALYDQLLAELEREDLMAAEVRAEIGTAREAPDD